VRFVANACNEELEVKKASDLALNSHCLILNLRALRYFQYPEAISSSTQHNVSEDWNLQQYLLENSKFRTTKDLVGSSSATLSSKRRLIKTRRIKLTKTSVAVQLVLTKLCNIGNTPARLRHVRHCLVSLFRMERNFAETALISIRIQKHTKASTELNSGKKDSLYHRLRLLKNPYVFGLLGDEHVPKNPKCNGTDDMYFYMQIMFLVIKQLNAQNLVL